MPVFSSLDTLETYSRSKLAAADFVYVDIGQARVHEGFLPWTGSRWHAAEHAQ